MMTAAIRVLYVDDELSLLDIGKIFLEESGDFMVTTALSAPEAIRLLGEEKFDVIISDYQMPEMDGIQFLVAVRTRFGQIPFILFTGRGREEVVIRALNSGADFYLQKGGEPEAQFAELSHKIKQAASRKRADDALKRSEEKYRHLIEHSDEAILVAQDGMLKLINHRLIELLGYPEQELLSTPFPVFIHPDDRTMVVERYQKRIKGEELPSRYPFRLNPKNENILWVEISAVVIDWDGRPATLNFLTDITESKHAEEERELALLEISDLYNNAPCGYHSLDKDGVYVKINDTELSWLGYGREEIIGRKKFSDLITEKSRENFKKNFPVFIERGWIHNLEFDMVRKNATILPVLVSATAIKNPDGSLLMSRSTLFDISERKTAEDALRISEEKYRKAFLTSPDSICITRLNDGMIVSANKGFADMTGYTEDEVIGKTSLEINLWKDPEDRRKIVEGLKARGEVRNYEARFLTKDGEIYGSMSASVIELDGVPHILNITRDISGRKPAKENLQEVMNGAGFEKSLPDMMQNQSSPGGSL